MASCCCCCGDKGKDTTSKKSTTNEADEIFDLEPPATQLEYIDEFLESPTSREVSESDSQLDEKQQIAVVEMPTQYTEENMDTMTPEFGYWNIRGRAEQVRILCTYVAEDYFEETYTFDPGPEYKSKDWEQKKTSSEYADLELPYWIEGKIRIQGATEIMEHIAEKHKLLPYNEDLRENLREINDKINELRSALEDFSNDRDWESNEDMFFRSITSKLYHLSVVLGNKNWISGKKISYPDFNFYDFLDMLRTLSPEIFANHLNLQNFMIRFEGLNHVKAYIRSDEFKQRPFFSPKAAWNGTRS